MAENWTACRRQVEKARQRRRLWAKIAATNTHLAGQACHPVDFRRGMAELARQADVELDEVEGQESDG